MFHDVPGREYELSIVLGESDRSIVIGGAHSRTLYVIQYSNTRVRYTRRGARDAVRIETMKHIF